MMVLSVVVIGVIGVIGIGRAVDAFAFPDLVDSSGGVWIDDPGGYVIFVVQPESAAISVADPSVTVTDPNGGTVATEAYETSRTATSFDQSSGTNLEAHAVATFHADEAGRYHLSGANPLPGTTLAVGEGVHGGFKSLALVSVGSGLVAIGGLVVVIVTAVRRRRDRPVVPWVTAGYPGAGFDYPGAGFGYPAPGSLVPPAGYPPHPPGFPVTPPGAAGRPPASGGVVPPVPGASPWNATPASGEQTGNWWDQPEPTSPPADDAGEPHAGDSRPF